MGELPPPPPRACFGRDSLIEEIVGLAENLDPVALIGAGGIGKTSIALSVLHNDRIKARFGDNRRFIRCDEFPPSRAHFLSRLSEVIGAGVENPKSLTPLRPSLTSREMFIVLDNAESILDPQGENAREIHTVVDELCQFKTMSVCFTSRITTIPRHCKCPEIPTLSMDSACDIFYGIYPGSHGERSNTVNDLVRRLDFHALSITLLATTASYNRWNYDRMSKEWDKHRAQVLRTDYNESLAATIELSLASPTFRNLGPDARDLLGVIAFFPQGIDEKNLDWLFPTISDRENIFDKFCLLSLAYRNNGFITTLAPLRDYLSPLNPKSSLHLCSTKDHYFTRLSVYVDPTEPGFREARWIRSEDVNVEYLLDVFASIDTDSDDVWDACIHFLQHIFWHKPRETLLRSKIEGLPDDHPFKPSCFFELSRLFEMVGNQAEEMKFLTRTLTLWRDRENSLMVAQTLRYLADVNRRLGRHKEGIKQAEEASQIYGRLDDVTGQAWCSVNLAQLLLDDGQLDSARDAASRTIDLIPEKSNEFLVCRSNRTLGDVHRLKREKERALHHFNIVLEIASSFDWRDQLFWTQYSLAFLYLDEREFDDAQTHVEQAKPHATEDRYKLGRAMDLQALIWYRQHRFEEAKLEALGALEIFEKLGAANDAVSCRDTLRKTEEAIESQSTGSQR